MELTQKQAIDAYRVVRKLEKQDMNGKAARTLFLARKALEPQMEFQDEQEHKAVDLLNCGINLTTGTIDFPSEEAREAYIKKMDEIAEMEVEIDWKKCAFDISELRLAPDDIEPLEFIVNIVC